MRARSDRVWLVGPRPVFRVRMAGGREVRATALHRLMGPGGWVRVQELGPGDHLALSGPAGGSSRRREPGTDLHWDTVADVTPEGTQEVYDLTVPGPSCWLADGVVSHNSGAIEQDADIVMFIHRDDSDPDPASKGRADIIVAKHRNGPTNTVPLTFLPHLTLFRNAAKGM